MSNNYVEQFKKNKFALTALWFLIVFFVVGLYAPLFATSKPLLVIWEGKFYFPLFRYLFFKGHFSKPIDLFYNLLMFTLPIGVLLYFLPFRKITLSLLAVLQIALFALFTAGVVKDPERGGETKSLVVQKRTARRSLTLCFYNAEKLV